MCGHSSEKNRQDRTVCAGHVCLNHLLHLSFSSVRKKLSCESCHEDLSAAYLGDSRQLQSRPTIHSKRILQNAALATT